MANYSFVIDSSFQPFSMQEMLTPLVMYKDAYEKTEAAYDELNRKADTFSYLAKIAEDNPDSKAAQIYKGYADELHKQAADFAKNGLNMSNRRALTDLKRRYSGEIGQLDAANTAMQEERKLRRQMNAKDSSMLYATDNLSLDDFLGGNNPNLYNISGTELYTRGAAAGKAFSSRIYNAGDGGKTLGGYYRDYVTRQGYDPDKLNKFQQEALLNGFTEYASSIPELQQAARNIMDVTGATENLQGNSLQRAYGQVIRGIVDNAVYAESHKPLRDEGVMSAGEAARINLSREQMHKNAAMSGLTWNTDTKSWDYNPDKDPALKKATTIAKIKAENSGGRAGAAYDVRNKDITMVGAKTGNVYKEDDTDGKGTALDNLPMRSLSSAEYSQLVDSNGNITNEYLRSAIGNGQLSDYEIYVIHPNGDDVNLAGTWGWMPWNWGNIDLDEDVYVAIPRDSKRAATESSESLSIGASAGAGSNDIPE